MMRRSFLSTLGSAGALSAAPSPPPPLPRPSTSHLPPRKVIVGTMLEGFWVPYPGVARRIEELLAIVDDMQAASRSRYGRGLDLAVLTEVALTGETGPRVQDIALPWEGAVREAFSRKARQLRCYIIVPTYLREAQHPQECSNAALLVDREGSLAGIYRKVHLVVSPDGRRLEGGSTPGREVPVFACDFGKLGIQICYDIEFDRGWQELARQGADLIAWPTQSPQTVHPAARALENRCYVVSSTWRHNATIFEPTGRIAAQLRPPGRVLVEEIDLSFAVLPWSSRLRQGKALAEKFGSRIGYRYYEEEDCGLFWSNDPQVPVREMIQSLGFIEEDEQLARARQHYQRAQVLDY